MLWDKERQDGGACNSPTHCVHSITLFGHFQVPLCRMVSADGCNLPDTNVATSQNATLPDTATTIANSWANCIMYKSKMKKHGGNRKSEASKSSDQNGHLISSKTYMC